jgi:hypothetical protein
MRNDIGFILNSYWYVWMFFIQERVSDLKTDKIKRYGSMYVKKIFLMSFYKRIQESLLFSVCVWTTIHLSFNSDKYILNIYISTYISWNLSRVVFRITILTRLINDLLSLKCFPMNPQIISTSRNNYDMLFMFYLNERVKSNTDDLDVRINTLNKKLSKLWSIRNFILKCFLFLELAINHHTHGYIWY